MARISTRLAHAWNAFTNQEERRARGGTTDYYGPGNYSGRGTRTQLRFTGGKTIISSIYTKLSVDVSSVDFRHCRLDEKKRYKEDMDTNLNDCLTLEANVDQSSEDLFQDVAMTLFDKGYCAIVPVDVTLDPIETGGYDIKTLRVGEIKEFKARHVKVNVWNVAKQMREDVVLEKRFVAVVYNPFFSVMNEPNSTLQRLLAKLSLLDAVDEQSASGKLDIIMQLPFTVRSDKKREQAEQRRKDIEVQLKGSQYGIAWADATEKITQLNRPAENNLMSQIEFLTDMLYGQLGLTAEIMNGSADEATMLNYNNRTIKPIVKAIQMAMKRSFLTKTARRQGQSIEFFRNPFELVPIAQIAEIADKFTRNEILSSNEIRQAIGFTPSDDPKADQLVNSNMPQADTGVPSTDTPAPNDGSGDTVVQGAFDEVNQALDSVFADLEVPLDEPA